MSKSHQLSSDYFCVATKLVVVSVWWQNVLYALLTDERRKNGFPISCLTTCNRKQDLFQYAQIGYDVDKCFIH